MLIFKKQCAVFVIVAIMFFSLPTINAVPSINIHTDKELYSYGEHLSFTVEVSEVTGELATLYVIDNSQTSSSAIPITITQTKTVFPSPYPFEEAVYPQGKYTLQIEYSGDSDTVEFELIDSGKIVIPSWIREFSKYWHNDQISDLEFADGIEFLIKEGIIIVPQSESQIPANEVKIPNWVKTSTGWWIDGLISDNEYAVSLEYLIKAGIIII